MEIFRDFSFEAAHLLPNVPAGHKCGRLHGHSFRTRIFVRGRVSAKRGWVLDFAAIKEAFEPLLQMLDHRYLNEIEGLENPTSEILARWIYVHLKPRLPGLRGVAVRETRNVGAEYRSREETRTRSL